jgi:hypothetical protein
VTRCPSGGGTWTAFGGGGGGVSSINSTTGAFTFTGAGVSCTGTTCTFSGTGSGVSQIVAGTNVTISPSGGTGIVTINASGGSGGGSGLFSQIMSATPTLSSTGLTTAWNQAGTFSATNTATGITFLDTYAISGGADYNEGMVRTYPSAAFTLTVLFSNPTFFTVAGEGDWFKLVIANTLSGNLETFGLNTRGSTFQAGGYIWSAPSTYSSTLFERTVNYSPFSWLQLKDNGTTVSLSISSDGVNWIGLYSEVKSSSSLGSAGYNYLGVGLDRQGTTSLGATLMSWTMTTP